MKLRNGRQINSGLEPYFIAEVNTSHFGEVGLAKEMIRQAKEMGADCVKFQSWTETSLYSQVYLEQNPVSRKFIKKLSFSDSQLVEMSAMAQEVGIDFASTPYSIEEAAFLVESCKVPFIKIASMDIVYLHYLRQLAELDIPIILSTGMSNMVEIKNAVQTLIEFGCNDLTILHCVSLYPTNTKDLNLLNITGLRKEFPSFPIGFSDHTMTPYASWAATALGAAVIEKHFTLDRSKIGFDNQMALECSEFLETVRGCKEVYAALGVENRIVGEEEQVQKIKMRRSALALENLEIGEVLAWNNVEFKRPGDGIAPDLFESLVGRKLKNSVNKGQVIKFEDVLFE